MLLSTIMAVTAHGILVYQRQNGEFVEIVGGTNGYLNLRNLQ